MVDSDCSLDREYSSLKCFTVAAETSWSKLHAHLSPFIICETNCERAEAHCSQEVLQCDCSRVLVYVRPSSHLLMSFNIGEEETRVTLCSDGWEILACIDEFLSELWELEEDDLGNDLEKYLDE